MAFSIENSVQHDPQRERLTLGRLRRQSGAVPIFRQMKIVVTRIVRPGISAGYGNFSLREKVDPRAC
jgi:hypothetical protein